MPQSSCEITIINRRLPTCVLLHPFRLSMTSGVKEIEQRMCMLLPAWRGRHNLSVSVRQWINLNYLLVVAKASVLLVC